MKARIVAQDHTVICYKVNGRKRFIVEPKLFISKAHKTVNWAVFHAGRRWSNVHNLCNEMFTMTPQLESKINELTH